MLMVEFWTDMVTVLNQGIKMDKFFFCYMFFIDTATISPPDQIF